jgi:hypothetical protein
MRFAFAPSLLGIASGHGHQILMSRTCVPQGSTVSMPSASADLSPGLAQAFLLGCEHVRLLDFQGKPAKTRGCLVAAAGTGTLPDVDSKMMMIAAGRQERSTVPAPCWIEADGAAVEAVGLGEIVAPGAAGVIC